MTKNAVQAAVIHGRKRALRNATAAFTASNTAIANASELAPEFVHSIEGAFGFGESWRPTNDAEMIATMIDIVPTKADNATVIAAARRETYGFAACWAW